MAVADAAPDPLSAGAFPETGRPAGPAPEGAIVDVLPDAPSEAGDITAGDGGGIDVARKSADGHADSDGDPGADGEGASRERSKGDEADPAAPTAGDHRVFRLHADRDRPGTVPVPGLRDDSGPRVGAGLPETVVRSAGGPIEVTLAPPELGRVHMALRDQDGALSLSLSADRPETLDLMRRHADLLEKDLRMLGYGSIAFHFGQGGSGSRAAAPPPLPADTDRPGATDPAPIPPAPGPALGAGASLDIRL
ncbi:MAG: flagellar hook-length control protein FliK [Pseudomonadota bacterium]